MVQERVLSSDSGDYEYYSQGEPDYGEDDDIYRVQPFADGIGEYDEYQQAWRFLGYMIDCQQQGDDDDYRRNLSGSYDGGTGKGCKRYVLWAGVSTSDSLRNR
jgi:hypothetical protein